MEPSSWEAALGVSALGESGAEVVSIVYLSSMFFMFPFENNSVFIFSPDDRKWASGAMAEAASVVGAVAKKMASSGVDSLSRVAGRLVASSAAPLFISLLLCFSDPVFCFR